MIACYGDLREIGILFLRSGLTYYRGKSNFLAAVCRDITKVDKAVCIRTFHLLFLGALRAFSYPLAQTSKFIGIRSFPNVLVLSVTTELLIF